ncbi:MAG: flagellar motor switch protein FliM [Mobiluncus porci]|uniref:Flagellar motor switch protein FliM n=1 Tax=Mobiluncus porci TaxID=2652278 RepID=A0A7K0K4M0_9ACTO|nr:MULTISPECIES: flagellar motor switch protein FliM [Mobiluncus]MCI6584712.1 flagellar motor switch protein FliM [Mobiluncus sp.]MDD7540981.1 flagellar motor switch protein FliM [Mobiluncus porci]MDY5748156.1 flagellar motor switch protein FliM [Mobiluncus porci]MST50010.1 flagellar motor switch protein FliM [Mobiluncus porci]
MAKQSKADRAAEARVYDFSKPTKLPREYARIMEMAISAFTRHWVNQLIGRLHVVMSGEAGDLSMRSYDDYIAKLPETTCMVIMDFQGGRNRGILQFPRQTALAWVDHLLGGQGDVESAPDRELTEVEVSILSDFLKRVMSDLDFAFSGMLPLETKLHAIEYSPQFVQALDGSTPVLFAPITLTVGEHVDDCTIMMPVAMITDAIHQGDTTDSRSEEQKREAVALRQRIVDVVEEVPIEVAVRFSRRKVNPRELNGLAVGDTLPLIHPTSRPLDLMVDDLVLAEAAAGTSGSRLAAMVVSVNKGDKK